MCNLDFICICIDGFRANTKTMILASNFTFPSFHILDRVIYSPMTVVRKIAGLQWPLLLLVILLGAFGIFAIYSATWMREQDFWNRQNSEGNP